MAVVDSVPVEYRLVPGTRGTIVVFHGGHVRAGLPIGETALIEAGYTVLSPSRPGYGRTPLTAGPSPSRFADITAALCRQLGLDEPLAVVGASAGGPTAVAMAAQHPTQVRALVLHSARSSLPFPDGAARWGTPVAFHRRVEAGTWAAVRLLMRRCPDIGLLAMMGTLSTLPARRVVEDLSPQERSTLVETFASMRSGAGFVADVRCWTGASLERRVTQPTLVVASRTDGQVRWKHAEQLSGSIPRSTLWTSPSLSHLIWFGSGAVETNRRTEDFLASV